MKKTGVLFILLAFIAALAVTVYSRREIQKAELRKREEIAISRIPQSCKYGAPGIWAVDCVPAAGIDMADTMPRH